MFIQLVGKIQTVSLMAIPLDDEEPTLLFNSVGEAKRELGIKGESDVCRAYKLERCHSCQYMFFQTQEDDTEEFLEFVAYYYRNNIATNYRRMKKDGSLMGVKVIWLNGSIVRDIYSRFMKAIDQ